MIIKSKSSFELAPQGDHNAVLVDVTPLKTMHSDWGDRDVFRLVFELEQTNADGVRYCAWSRPYTPSTHEKSSFYPVLLKLLGRNLTKSEKENFDTEILIG